MTTKKTKQKPSTEPARAAPEASTVSVAMPTAMPQESPLLESIKPSLPAGKPEPTHAAASIGVWAYIVGLAVAIAGAFFVDPAVTYYGYVVLALLGFIVGLLNITERETLIFLVACVAFIVSANSVKELVIELPVVVQALSNVIIFTAASAFIISLRAIIRVSRDE